MTDKLAFRIGCNQCGIVHEDWENVNISVVKIYNKKYKRYNGQAVAIAYHIKCNKCGSIVFCGDGRIIMLISKEIDGNDVRGAYRNYTNSDKNSLSMTTDADKNLIFRKWNEINGNDEEDSAGQDEKKDTDDENNI